MQGVGTGTLPMGTMGAENSLTNELGMPKIPRPRQLPDDNKILHIDEEVAASTLMNAEVAADAQMGGT